MTKAEKTKRFIVEKAAVLFNQKGYAGTSMSDIMEATGLTKGGLYGNFKNKEDISVAAFQYAVEEVANAIRVRTKVIDDATDKLKAVVYFYREKILNPPIKGGCPILNTSVEADDNHPILREMVLAQLNLWKTSLVRTITKGQGRGEIKEAIDSEKFAILFITTIEGGIMLTRVYNDKEKFQIISEHLLEMINNIKK